MQVQVPAGLQPGQQFQINANGQIMSVTVPSGMVGGQTMLINVPGAAQQQQQQQYASTKVQQGTAPPPQSQAELEKTKALFQQPQQGATVNQAMPTAPPMSSLQGGQMYDESGYQLEKDAGPQQQPANQEGVYDASGQNLAGNHFFTPQELQQLQSQPLPVDTFRPSGAKDQGAINMPNVTGVQVVQAGQAQTVIQNPVLVTAAGMPIVTNAVSGAKTDYDGYKGVKSCDEILQQNADEIMLFLQTHNTRPRLSCRVHGYHQERRTRTVRDSEGRTRTETYYVTVTDFDYKIDLTNFIFPYGYIQSVRDKDKDGKPDPIPQIIQEFIDDTNKLKTLQMKKYIAFDFNTLRCQVRGYIRALGWRRGLSVSFPQANYSVRVWSRNCLSSMWENTCCWCLCHLTIIPCIFMRCYRDCGGHAEKGIQSHFEIQYHPRQIFEMIRPALWCPGYGAMDMMGEVFRNVFW
jgi:hypothetical protein